MIRGLFAAHPRFLPSVYRGIGQVIDSRADALGCSLKASSGNYTQAAKILGLHPTYLHRLVRNLNMRAELEE